MGAHKEEGEMEILGGKNSSINGEGDTIEISFL